MARGPDSTFGFRRSRKSSMGVKHVPLKPIQSEENLLDTPTLNKHVPLRPVIQPKVSSDSYNNTSDDAGET